MLGARPGTVYTSTPSDRAPRADGARPRGTKSTSRKSLPAARLFPLESLSELIQVAEKFHPEYGHRIDEHRTECRDLRAVIDRFCPPDILVVDLAMCNTEAERMTASGGNDIINEVEPCVLPDPREILRSLTGFKVLRAYARSVPVIVTSYFANPLVAQHCLVNGAFAYVRKPVLGVRTDNEYDFRHAVDIGATAMDKAAREEYETA